MIKLFGLFAMVSLTVLQDAVPPPVPVVVPAPVPEVGPEPAPVAPSAPDLGAELVQARCTSCHGVSRFADQRLTAAQWQETVDRMIGNGARITPDEAPEIVAYLARTQGPEPVEPAAAQ